MKLTPAGRDYLLAIPVLAAIGWAAGQVFEALALAMAVGALISALILRRTAARGMRAKPVDRELRVFKGEHARTVLALEGSRSDWVTLELGTVGAKGTIDAKAEAQSPGKMQLVLMPHASGRFRLTGFTAAMNDPLNLFSAPEMTVSVNLTLDSLPLSLIEETRRPQASPLTLGEKPGRTAGKGQEFHGIDEYAFGSESKDIIWRRVASSPDQRLFVRVRESNIPQSVTVAIVEVDTGSEGRSKNVDLLCEALGRIGRSLLELDVDLVISGADGRRLSVGSLAELVEAIMEASAWTPGREIPQEAGEDASVVLVIGEGTPLSSHAHALRPRVLIGGRSSGRNDVVFSGKEDLSKVINAVLGA